MIMNDDIINLMELLHRCVLMSCNILNLKTIRNIDGIHHLNHIDRYDTDFNLILNEWKHGKDFDSLLMAAIKRDIAVNMLAQYKV